MIAATYLYSDAYRQDEVSNAHGSRESLDARLVLLQRAGGTLSQHHRAQRVRQDLPQRQRALQHPVSAELCQTALCNYNLHLCCSISLTLSCPMNLKLYPLDRQMCSLLMISCKLHIFRKDRPS